MTYDDRLATVLRLKVNGAATARIQYSQLLDLLGTSPAEARGELIDTAYHRLAELSARISASERVGMVRDPALRLRSPRLVATLTEFEPQLAGAAVVAAQLSDEQWVDLIPALSPAARAAIGTRRTIGPLARGLLARLGVGVPALPAAEARAVRAGHASPIARASERPERPGEPAAAPDAIPEVQGIGAIVRRIEAFRKARDEAGPAAAPGDSPRLPLGEEATRARAASQIGSFDFIADSSGRITWSDPRITPMVVGIELGEIPGLGEAIRRHQPIRAANVTLEGAPAITGTWQVDASPGFAPDGGRFVGHLGRFHRIESQASTRPSAGTEADRLRQLLHELRTPVNAIQGFAEIIQQQLFGPTPHEYRALAAVIAGDSARMLAGFEELERFARLDAGSMELAQGESDLATTVTATILRLNPFTSARGSGFALHTLDEALPLTVAQIEIERLCWRLLAALAASAAPGEMLTIVTQRQGAKAQLILQLPTTLTNLDDEALLHAGVDTGAQAISASLFGTGFALRLAASEARAAGGQLAREQGNLNLLLPLSHDAARHDKRAEAG